MTQNELAAQISARLSVLMTEEVASLRTAIGHLDA